MELTKLGDTFAGFHDDFKAQVVKWKAVFDAEDPLAANVNWPSNLKDRATPLERALILLAIRYAALLTVSFILSFSGLICLFVLFKILSIRNLEHFS
jgi:hypothetical protein